MKFSIDHTGTEAGLQLLLGQLQHKDIQAVVIMSCVENGFTPHNIDPILKSYSKPVFGAIFPEIFAEGQRLKKGTICIGLERPVHTLVLPDIKASHALIQDTLRQWAAEEINTVFTFVDAFSPNITPFIESIFSVLGNGVNYLGGGSGNLATGQAPCILTNEGLLQDAAILLGTPLQCGIGVRHGWSSASGPVKVTESNGNKIISLDGKPACDVYLKLIEEHKGHEVTKEMFSSLAQAHPFGIAKLDSEYIVRDPYEATEKDEIFCFGDIPQGSHVVLLKGNTDDLIAAARQAKEDAKYRCPTSDKTITFFIDCISRARYMKDDFTKEIAAVKGNDALMIGACTIGEIANSGTGYLEFYNKTAVVGIMSEE
ncbi:MAG: FIST signal transduction protein [Desulfovibrio sp.]